MHQHSVRSSASTLAADRTRSPAATGAGCVSRRDGGSFRDPSGFVFFSSGDLLRQVNRSYQPEYDYFVTSGLAETLITQGMLVTHEERPLSEASDGDAYKVLKPQRIPFISYPYEWCFSELKDGALLTLRAQLRALAHGMSLKDASAFNVQFIGSRPILIDTLSFERHADGQPWKAYRQFCQHFLAPLALMAHTDVRLSQLSRVYIDGVPLDLASSLLPWRTRIRPVLAAHIHLHARMQAKHADSRRSAKSRAETVSRRSLVALLESMARTVEGLEWKPAGTEWGSYYADTNYSETAAAAKAHIVQQMIQAGQPRVVWDLGANTGKFSRLASSLGIRTIAFDLDPAAVEKNYRECKASGDENLLPLVLDLTNPSAGMGWAGEERLSVEQRGPADAVLALALIHHLAIGNNVPLWKIADFLRSVAAKDLIIEFVPKQDSQVERLLASRDDIFPDYTQAGFESAFERQFDLVGTQQIPDSHRVLYHMRRRAS